MAKAKQRLDVKKKRAIDEVAISYTKERSNSKARYRTASGR
jgi:hypothetical protein